MSISSANSKSSKASQYVLRNAILKCVRVFFRTIGLKEKMWDYEYSAGMWDYIAHTTDDPIYSWVEKYSKQADILDLGCGAGTMGNELSYDAYRTYTGVDISNVAITRAISWSEQCGRSDKNIYIRSDIENYVPDKKYRVILFREFYLLYLTG